MATCKQLVGNWTRLTCGGEIVQGRCQRCGALANDRITDYDSGSARVELSFSNEELEQFGVVLSPEHGAANPPEWGNDPFTDFT
ncbi:MAG: hypothetical protein H6970_10850 [Gammaproteobacteria bacterium]|nr:hypothetical protein [Gammaproteobacteria bacterium]MCP5459331.1 hypothetical protein [Gammaproteobacteria bacterium]